MLRLYRALLFLYPVAYRRRFGRDMAEMFADELAAARCDGISAVIRLWGKTLADLAVNAPAAYLPAHRLSALPPNRQALIMNLPRDFRMALRALTKHPLFTAIAIITIGLGIGANTAIFSVVNGVMLKPLPYQAPEDLAMVWSAYPDSPRFSVSAAEYLDLRAEAESFENIGAYSTQSVTVIGMGRADRQIAANTSSSIFDVLGVSATIGRTFAVGEDRPGGANVVILSHAYWTSRYGADPKVVGGEAITLDGTSFDVIGVLPERFELPTATADLYLPLPLDRNQITNRSGHSFNAVGRLRPGATLAIAEAELATILPRWAEQYEGLHANDPLGHPLLFVPLEDQLLGTVRPMMWALLGAVGLVLLLATANVANLLLARGESRGREMGIRGALGAGRSALVQQLMTESVVLASAGGALGLGIAAGLISLFKWLDPGGIPRLALVSLDGVVLAVTAGVTLFTGLLFGVLPALQASRRDVKAVLVAESRGGSRGRESKGVLQTLVVTQMAFAVVLLVGSGVLIRSFLALQSVDPGFETEQRVAFRVQIMGNAYPERSDKLAFYEGLRQELEAIPGVMEVAMARGLPLRTGIGTEGIAVEGRVLGPDDRNPSIDYQIASDSYFELMGVPVVGGRTIEASDRDDTPLVILINEAAAHAYFQGEDPVGQRARLLFTPSDWPNVTIVGVVGDVHQRGLASDARPEIYVPLQQVPPGWSNDLIGSLSIVLRTGLPLETVGATIRQVVQEVDPNVPVSDLATLDAAVTNDVATERFITMLLGLFAAVALIISAVGVYGVMAFSVARRTREIGIRLALGAEPSSVVGSVLRNALTVAIVGGAIGLVAASMATTVLESLVYQVSVRDAGVFIASPIVLVLVALVASLVPAWRAAAVQPMETLRSE